MDDPIKCQIERVNGQIKQAELYALWWMARASSGEIKGITLYHGLEGDLFTDSEKIEDAIKTARTHIQRIEELVETKITLMKQLEE